MSQEIHEKISVITAYNSENGSIMPRRLRWHGREYLINKLGYHHTVRQGRVLLHIFHVTDGTVSFRLCLNTETLHWTLEEVYDELEL